MRPATEAVVERLLSDGCLRRVDGRLRTTRRWQGAMARAAKRLAFEGDPFDDLRVPIAAAMLETYGSETTDEELMGLIAVMLPIEADELSPRVPL